MAEADPKKSYRFVSGFARGLSVIEAFGPTARQLTVADVAAKTGLDRAVARRLLLTLQELGFVSVDRRKYELTPRILHLGYSYLATVGLDGATQPFLDALSREIGDTVSLSVLSGDRVVFIARSDAFAGHSEAGRISYTITPGMTVAAYASASGRMLMSALPPAEMQAILARSALERLTPHTETDPARLAAIVAEARSRGFALNEQETELDLLGASVLVRSRSGRPVAALNTSSYLGRVDRRRMIAEVIPRLQACAEKLTGILL